ncbi:MAG TPA: TrmH family RNA methyltransferase [Candidatus Saccharimonadales bacterium]|nr:TrmH family RNA methyltransferase [Candidatus Saccharimonadales bacterium]
MNELTLIAHNLRSAHNVGSLLRTAEGLGVGKIWLTGYSPYPLSEKDSRLPHLARSIDARIAKTALGAEKLIEWEQADDIGEVLEALESQGFTIAALEQAPDSISLPTYRPPAKLALIVGREIEGVEAEVLSRCDLVLEIPMPGRKESFNVTQAAAMAVYHLRFIGPRL